MQIAQTIADQIGHRAFLMMGSRHKLAGDNFLVFDIRGSKAFNKIQITLDPMDTYTVEFFKFRQFDRVNYLKLEGVYEDMLHDIIQSHTGLYLSL